MNHVEKSQVFIAALLMPALLTLSGCHPHASSQQIPSPTKVAAADGNGYLAFYRWEGGPTVLICCDVKPDRTGFEENSGGSPWSRKNTGYVGLRDGPQVEWHFETTDNRTVKTQINGAERDLAAGNVFLVKTQGGTTVFEQVQRDLSGVKADAESVKAYAAGDEEMRRLLGAEGK